MAIRRQNTVHDYSSLRLHPDGSRVQNLSEPDHRQGSVPTAASTRLAKYTTRDAQGRWIAHDAGGLAAVKQRTRTTNSAIQHEQDPDTDVGSASGEGNVPIAGPSRLSRSHDENRTNEEFAETVAGYTQMQDSRAKKRMKFYHDYSFLDHLQTPEHDLSVPDILPAGTDEGFLPGIQFPVPSSELLKGIHHFASHFYSEKGWLYNAPALARKLKKERSLKDLRRKVAERSAERSAGNDIPQEDDIHDSHMSLPADNDEVGPVPKKSRRSKHLPQRDMYRAFDGSALMALGMLVQEYVGQVSSQVPSSEWLDQIAKIQCNQGKKKRRRKKRRQVPEHMSAVNNNIDPSRDNDEDTVFSADVAGHSNMPKSGLSANSDGTDGNSDREESDGE